MTNLEARIAGIDSHKGTIHVAVITSTGVEVTDKEFPTTQIGYRQVIAWLNTHGRIGQVGIEGTSSYGVGVTATLRQNGITVVEVSRTRPAERRKQGKTDRMDAYRAARSVVVRGSPPQPPKATPSRRYARATSPADQHPKRNKSHGARSAAS